MPKRSNAFQRLIFLINKSLAEKACVTESAMLVDKITGDEREVDILISTKTMSYEVNIAIEVVSRRRKIGTTWIEEMRSKHSSLEVNKTILVSESGFTRPALKKARFYGFEAIEMDMALDADWELATNLTKTGFFELTLFNYTCSLIYLSDDGKLTQIEVPPSTLIANDSHQMTLGDFVRYVLNRQETRETLFPRIKNMNERQFWFNYSKPGGLWDMKIDGTVARITELRVGLDVNYTRTPVEFSANRYKKDVPFVSGVSEDSANQLQFALVRQPDGAVEGMLLDEDGAIRKLSNFS